MMRAIVLGLGNILYGDEGFGVRVAEHLYTHYDFPEDVEIVDAGTQGHKLLTYVEQTDRLLLLDAVDFDLVPGTMVHKDSAGIPTYLSAHKVSVHQNSFSEVLALADLKDILPEEIHLIGMQPLDMSFGTTLTPLGREKVVTAAALALEQLAKWGIRATPAKEQKQFHAPEISMENFAVPAGTPSL